MSTLTGLYGGGASSGGGSESHIVTDPKKLLRYGNGAFNINYDFGGNIRWTNEVAFFSSIAASHFGASAQCVTNDTYATLLDITGSDGGYLHWIVSPKVSSSNLTTVKITVDGGTPVEIAYAHQAGASARMFIGGGLYVGLENDNLGATTFESGFARFNNAHASGFDAGQLNNYEDPVNNVLATGSYADTTFVNIERSFVDLITLPYQRLYFSSSLKIEVKQQTLYTDLAGEYAACFYSLM